MTMAALEVCSVCNGRAQIAAGVACPVCDGTGVAAPERVAGYRATLEQAAAEAARQRFAAAGSEAASGWFRTQAQARDDTLLAAGRAAASADRAEAAAAAMAARQDELLGIALRLEAMALAPAPAALPPDPTDPPPGVVLPAGMGGELNYMDSLLVRQLDVWGVLNAPALTVGAAVVVQPLGPVGTVDDAANINATFNLLGPGAWVQLNPSSSYTLKTQLVVPGATPSAPGCRLSGGRGTVLFSYFGGASSNTGAAVSCHGSELGAAPLEGYGSIIELLTIDGTNVPGTSISTGLDYGDQYHGVIRDVTIQNFTSTGTTTNTQSNPLGAVGLNVNNQVHLTEKLHVARTVINNCTNCFQTVNTTGNSTSHMYADIDITVNAQPHQNGWVVARQGHLENGIFKMRGNFYCDSNPANCSVIVMGQGNQAGHTFNVAIDINVESDNAGAGITQPHTITFGTNADNTISTWIGRVRFSNNFQPAVGLITGPTANFQMSGRLTGDSTLAATSAPYSSLTSGTVYTNNGIDAIACVSGGTVTGILLNGVSAANLISGPFLVPMNTTFQINFSVAPTISWLGALPS